jgi:hypothetical protein
MSFAQQVQLMTSVRLANLDWNIQPAMASGVLNPYGGVSAFFPTDLAPTNVNSKLDPDIKVDVAYLVAIPYMKIVVGEKPGLSYEDECQNKVCHMSACLGAVRVDECGVVVLESDPANNFVIPKIDRSMIYNKITYEARPAGV